MRCNSLTEMDVRKLLVCGLEGQIKTLKNFIYPSIQIVFSLSGYQLT